ncbi:phosphoribosyltransferase family protein [Pontibacter sp. SGAir0037]|uniref:phosphoribosyltransferase family protein n=1 Tax=Pontibacter sp. SGAir0037 TaxID=2571030 RepID=UPI0010CD03A2|nr:phosphoribosyltransferase family protein [Pontibacter sp. SGAir0037]QCR24727.1 phosphoribosyltransferase [Pontibacter sp. SGAir0037]
MTHPHQTLILDKTQIQQKVTRMAYEIYEQNFEEQALVLAGIQENGYILAEMLLQQLQTISDKEVSLLSVTLDKSSPLEKPVEVLPSSDNLENKTIIIVDDVLNTGKTLAYTLNTFLPYNPKKVEIATLVNRHHTLFPVSATYTGYSLATTLGEHVAVVLKENEVAAYLH